MVDSTDQLICKSYIVWFFENSITNAHFLWDGMRIKKMQRNRQPQISFVVGAAIHSSLQARNTTEIRLFY